MSRIAGGLGGTRHWSACREGIAAVKHVEDLRVEDLNVEDLHLEDSHVEDPGHTA